MIQILSISFWQAILEIDPLSQTSMRCGSTE